MATAGSERPPSDPIGQDFGQYKLVRRLGVGGMAETFEAIRTGPSGFSQRVCLKVVLPFFRDRQDFRELFEREARLAAKLRHSNVVGVIDFGEIDGVTYMALELVDGVDLASLLDAQPNGRLPHEYVVLLGHELAAALQHAHDPRRESSAGSAANNAIIHRDLSPSNVLVSRRGEILLTDFGVAKAITGTARQQSAVKGKVPYMSPEQLRADKLDGRADLFALGVLLFEALAGQRPFQGEHDPATIMQILQGQRASLGGLAPHAPPDLCDAIESLLEPDRDDRPENAGAVLELLDPFVPPPQIRRELGKMAAQLHAAQLARPSEPAMIGIDSTELQAGRPGDASGVSRSGGSLAPDAEAESNQPVAPVVGGKRSRSGLGLLLLGLAALVLAIALWPGEVGAPEPPAEDVQPAAEPTPEPADIEAPPDAVPEDTVAVKEAAPEVPAVRPASLTVFVFPWGDVWIDGKRKGTAPVRNVSLKPGRYKISAGRGKPSKTKVIRLRDAQRKTVEFDLTK